MMRTFSRFPPSHKVGGMHHQQTSSNSHGDIDPNYHLREIRGYLNSLLQFNPGAFLTPEPRKWATTEAEGVKTDAWYSWEYERDMWERRLRQTGQHEGLENWIKTTIYYQGLDVVLGMRTLPEGYDWFWDHHHDFWISDDWYLIQVITNPGPLFITFIASNYQVDPSTSYHISIIYRHELWEWYMHLYRSRGREHANTEAIRWIDTYRVVQARYDGKTARLRGRLTRGYTLELNEHTHVNGVESPDQKLWDGSGGDQEMHFIHRLPGNNFPEGGTRYKSKQEFHVSLLNSRVPDE